MATKEDVELLRTALRSEMENGLTGLRSEVKDVHRQLEVKDTQIGALLERLREANVIIAKSNQS